MWLVFGLLSMFAWALVNVFNSVFVHNYSKSPFVMNWIQSAISIVILLLISLSIDVRSSWIPILLFFGITAYFGDLWFFHVLNKVDVSVLNAAWSILAVLLSIAGFILFDESWTIYQTLGAILILGGTSLVSYYHKHVNIWHTLWLFFVLALLYLPFYIVKKAAIDAHESIAAVFFWMLIGREILSLCTPIFNPKIFTEAIRVLRIGWVFPLTCTVTICTYFLAEFWGALSYQLGPISLVSVVGDLQPFAVMGVASLYIYFWPHKAPKELLTRQSVKIKFISFSTVFIGLALIAINK